MQVDWGGILNVLKLLGYLIIFIENNYEATEWPMIDVKITRFDSQEISANAFQPSAYD